jgi:hypothetical protein
MGLSKAHTLSTFGIDASNIHFVDGFDYCAITQSNADKINAWIKKLGPKLVFIPHWKSTNPDELILGRTSLIACRGIGNILMYEPQDNNNFVPSVLFPKSANRTDLNSDESESYESHRILLLDEVEMI